MRPLQHDAVRTISATDPASSNSALRESLDQLARLPIETGPDGLAVMLEHVARLATHAVPGADGSGVTLFEGGRIDVVAASANFARAVDEIQQRLDEGPCVTAAGELRTVRSGSVGREAQWPRFGPRASKLGVRSVLSLPLTPGDSFLATINVYARAENAFNADAVSCAEAFARPASISVQTAQALSRARREIAQLQTALTSRAVIDQALGIVMSRSGCSTEEAFARLRSTSQAEGHKLATVAQQVLDESVRRARARRTAT